MTITTRAELHEALRQVLVDAIADEPSPDTDEGFVPGLVTIDRQSTSPPSDRRAESEADQ